MRKGSCPRPHPPAPSAAETGRRVDGTGQSSVAPRRRGIRGSFAGVSVARVAALTYYPVKGLAGVSVNRSQVSGIGLRHDRTFMLVNPDGSFVSQRTVPAMAPLRAVVLGDGERLLLSVEGADDLEVEVT